MSKNKETKEKRSYNELNVLFNDFQQMFKKASKYKSELVYIIKKNIQALDAELAFLREELPENAEGFKDYLDERIEILEKLGAEIGVNNQGNKFVKDAGELDEKKFEKEVEKLNKKHKEVLDKQEEVSKKQQEYLSKKQSDLELRTIRLSLFPTEISGEEMPFSILDLIEEE